MAGRGRFSFLRRLWRRVRRRKVKDRKAWKGQRDVERFKEHESLERADYTSHRWSVYSRYPRLGQSAPPPQPQTLCACQRLKEHIEERRRLEESENGDGIVTKNNADPWMTFEERAECQAASVRSTPDSMAGDFNPRLGEYRRLKDESVPLPRPVTVVLPPDDSGDSKTSEAETGENTVEILIYKAIKTERPRKRKKAMETPPKAVNSQPSGSETPGIQHQLHSLENNKMDEKVSGSRKQTAASPRARAGSGRQRPPRGPDRDVIRSRVPSLGPSRRNNMRDLTEQTTQRRSSPAKTETETYRQNQKKANVEAVSVVRGGAKRKCQTNIPNTHAASRPNTHGSARSRDFEEYASANENIINDLSYARQIQAVRPKVKTKRVKLKCGEIRDKTEWLTYQTLVEVKDEWPAYCDDLLDVEELMAEERAQGTDKKKVVKRLKKGMRYVVEGMGGLSLRGPMAVPHPSAVFVPNWNTSYSVAERPAPHQWRPLANSAAH